MSTSNPYPRLDCCSLCNIVLLINHAEPCMVNSSAASAIVVTRVGLLTTLRFAANGKTVKFAIKVPSIHHIMLMRVQGFPPMTMFSPQS